MVRSQEGRRFSLQGRMQFERRVPVAELLTRSQREGGAGGRGAGVVGGRESYLHSGEEARPWPEIDSEEGASGRERQGRTMHWRLERAEALIFQFYITNKKIAIDVQPWKKLKKEMKKMTVAAPVYALGPRRLPDRPELGC